MTPIPGSLAAARTSTRRASVREVCLVGDPERRYVHLARPAVGAGSIPARGRRRAREAAPARP